LAWRQDLRKIRYLRASKWQQNVAIQKLENTLRWRREFGLYSHVTGDHVSEEVRSSHITRTGILRSALCQAHCYCDLRNMQGLTGKEQVFGYDALGRPALYMLPSRQNTEESHRQVEYTVFLLERCTDLMPPGVECVLLVSARDDMTADVGILLQDARADD
jgi:hypothetical protein